MPAVTVNIADRGAPLSDGGRKKSGLRLKILVADDAMSSYCQARDFS